MYPHRIRLRGPWECEPLAPAARPRRVLLPGRLADYGLPAFVGRLRLTRKFGYPGRIDEGERVWLVFDGLTGRAEASLNGTRLTRDLASPAAFDVTGRLTPRNQLTVDLTAESEDAGLWGDVALEIRRTAFLADVSAHRDPDGSITVVGRVGGDSPHPLELYALLDGKHVHYATVAAGSPFAFTLHDLSGANLRLDLVHVSTVWYAVETPIG